MADKPESIRGARTSRHTQTIRRAAAEDARRRGVESGRLSSPSGDKSAPSASARPANARERSARVTAVIGKDAKLISGRFVGRESGGGRTSVRVRGGDTLIRLKSGETLIRRRVVAQTRTRRNVLAAYAAGYVVVFSLYTAFLLTATHEMTPVQYLEKAFAKRQGESAAALRRAAIEAARGNRTPAEVRFARSVSFHDAAKNLVVIAPGDRVTLPAAAKLGEAIIADFARDEANRSFSAPFVLYKETWLAGVDWPYWLMCCNLLGFYLLAVLYLWKPINDFLGTQCKKISISLENARNAHIEAEELRDGLRALAAEIDARRERMEADLEAEAEAAHEAAMATAGRQARDIAGGTEAAVEAELRGMLARLKSSTALAACLQAGELLADRTRQEDHDRAIEALIADISAMKPC